MNGIPDYPLGVTERHISYPDPIECKACDGEGELSATPCCRGKFIEVEDGYACACGEKFGSKKCEECKGKGVVAE